MNANFIAAMFYRKQITHTRVHTARSHSRTLKSRMWQLWLDQVTHKWHKIIDIEERGDNREEMHCAKECELFMDSNVMCVSSILRNVYVSSSEFDFKFFFRFNSDLLM